MYIKALENFIKTNGNQGGNTFEKTSSVVMWWRNRAVESAKEQIELYKVGKGRLQNVN